MYIVECVVWLSASLRLTHIASSSSTMLALSSSGLAGGAVETRGF